MRIQHAMTSARRVSSEDGRPHRPDADVRSQLEPDNLLLGSVLKTVEANLDFNYQQTRIKFFFFEK